MDHSPHSVSCVDFYAGRDPQAGKYMSKCLQLGPPWIVWDDFSEELKALYVKEVSQRTHDP